MSAHQRGEYAGRRGPHCDAALNNATLPFVLALADKGTRQALLDDPHLLNGLNVANGLLCRREVAQAQQVDFVPTLDALVQR